MVADNCGWMESLTGTINEVLLVVKWIALALTIILGIIDFIQGAASGDLKKAATKFMKRMIAVVLLFVVQALIEWLLGLAEFNGDCITKIRE
jgi:hypothetical protein